MAESRPSQIPGALPVKPVPTKVPESFVGQRPTLDYWTNVLYRETNGDYALWFIPELHYSVDMSGDLYFANVPNLAFGQGSNKGVILEIDPTGLKGFVNRKAGLPMVAAVGGEVELVGRYNTQKDYQKALRSITILSDAKMGKVARVLLKRDVLPKYTRIPNTDGSVTWRRPVVARNPSRRRPYYVNPEAWEMLAHEWGDAQIEPMLWRHLDAAIHEAPRLPPGSPGVKMGILGDFLRGTRVRSLFRNVLNVPLYYSDFADIPIRPDEHNVANVKGDYLPIAEGGPRIRIRYPNGTDDLAETLYHEAAHAHQDLRKQKLGYNRPDLPAYDEWIKYPFEKRAERVAKYSRGLQAKEMGHRALVARAIAEGQRVPTRTLLEYPELIREEIGQGKYPDTVNTLLERVTWGTYPSHWPGSQGAILPNGSFVTAGDFPKEMDRVIDNLGVEIKGNRVTRFIELARMGKFVLVDGRGGEVLRLDIVAIPFSNVIATIEKMLRAKPDTWGRPGILKYRLHGTTVIEGSGISQLRKDIDRAWLPRST